jgi:hypothetical protein
MKIGAPFPFAPIAMTEPPSAGVGRPSQFLTVSLARELGVLLCLSVMFPFLIHIVPVPETAKLGPRLLPMFYAPLLAVLWGRPQSALAVALLAPWLNWALTAHPAPIGGIIMTIELLVFVAALQALLARVRPHGFLAAPAFFVGMAAATAAAALFPALIGGHAALAWAAQSVAIGIPGIAILVLINVLALRYHPPGASGGGPAAA